MNSTHAEGRASTSTGTTPLVGTGTPVGADSGVDVTVVIPTYNRRDRLRRVLASLDRQTTVTHRNRAFTFNVVVVSDGSTDGTVEMARALEIGYDLQVLDQENSGPGAARNHGARVATGHILLFIDDDVIPAPGCLCAHVSRHDDQANLVVIGPMLTPRDFVLSPWVAWEQHQLDKQYRSFEAGQPAFSRQFYTGNASVERAAFERTGGFDTTFRRAEDVELGYRLEAEAQSFAFEPRAAAHHYAERSFESWLRMASDYGRHDVTFSELHESWDRQEIAQHFADRHPVQRRLVRWAAPSATRTARTERILSHTALKLHQLRLLRSARGLLSLAYGLSYYHGMAAALGTAQAFDDVLNGRTDANDRQFCALFVLEQTLGHVTHAKNLRSLVPRCDTRSVVIPVESDLRGAARFIPGWSNWTVRAGVRARRSLRHAVAALDAEKPPARADAVFVHSQVPAVLLGRWMRRVPTVVSLDATPLQYDALGAFYGHAVGSSTIESIKHWANRRCFERARHIVTWSDWAKQGLVDDYGVSAEKVTVVAPGVDVELWSVDRRPPAIDDTVRILFVGGDLERKGGDLLIDAWRRLSMGRSSAAVELHLVTNAEVPAEPGLFVHRGLTANSGDLIQRYRSADIFCLPTLGDCLPMVLAEAAAAGLPLVSSDVGAIGELVRDGETGRLVPPGDVDALVVALRDLVDSSDERARFGAAARKLAYDDHDALKNSRRIVAVLQQAASEATS